MVSAKSRHPQHRLVPDCRRPHSLEQCPHKEWTRCLVQPQVQLLEQFELTLKKPGTTADKLSVVVWSTSCMATAATSAVIASRTPLQIWHEQRYLRIQHSGTLQGVRFVTAANVRCACRQNLSTEIAILHQPASLSVL